MKALTKIEFAVPKQIIEARRELTRAKATVRAAKTYEQIKRIEQWAGAMKIYWSHIVELRREAETLIILAGWRSGQMAIREGQSRGGIRGNQYAKLPDGQHASPKLSEMFGSTKRGTRLRKLGKIESEQELMELIRRMHEEDREATVSAVLRFMGDDLALQRKRHSRAAATIPDGMDLRIGDCRDVLRDVVDDSVALVLTDPPYPEESEPLYRWLAEWSARVLVPGGSLVCVTGHWSINRDVRIFDERLRYWWLLAMMHQQSRRLPGKFVIANFKPVLWYVKDYRRGRSLVPDVLRPSGKMGEAKDLHDWAQDAEQMRPIIQELTEPGEMIADPFAGSAQWGRLAHSMGRRWVGSDVVMGGDVRVVAAEAAE